MENPKDWYTQRIVETEDYLHKTKGIIFRISMLRVLFFLAGIAGIIYFFHAGAWIITASICCTFVPFLALVKIHNRFFYRKVWLETRLQMNKNELAGLDNDYSAFDEGKEFINPNHLYSYDLDLFGKKSLFQAVDRTCTPIGKKALAHWFNNHLTDKKRIESRQESVKDLSKRKEFRERFYITGTITRGKENDEEEIRKWSDTSVYLSDALWARITILVVPVINLLLLAGGLSGIFSLKWLGLSFMCFVILSFAIIRRATAVQESFGEKLKSLNTYAKLISLAKQEQWESEELKDLTDTLNIEGKSPAEALERLSKELDRLDLRNNQFLYVILEGCLFFQLQQIVRIERWKKQYGKYIMNWLEAVGKLDALCSLANFAYNHPTYCYPQISDRPFIFEAKGMGHPLIPEKQCVRNDADIPSRPFFLIITGANMAGKSTYLRTIGINYLLACIGTPVCCLSLKIYPARLVTSLRTSDSLSENESYFFAELKRLKMIIDMLGQGETLFIILDEILKGTNSADKQKGSFNLIKQFMGLQANGIIATHDLLLGKLAESFPDSIRNYCFEADIRDNELSFSYRLRKGVAQNMNACFLMKKMGITIDE